MDYPYVNIHTHKRTGEGIELVSSMALSGKQPEPPCSVGIHPWQVGKIDIGAALAEVAETTVSAIGEIGLDYAKPNDWGHQKDIFEAQLQIAEEHGLPVILHCVKAFEPMMKMLQRRGDIPAVIFHGFVGSPQQAVRAAEAGYYLSFGERSLASPKTVDAMNGISVSRMFFETDDSEMTIAEVYCAAARILGVDVGELKKMIYSNYTEIFGK